ncbi:hypothetical protein MW290_07660 [Aquincola tertiaricarbonis]|uniref:Uncharacterized protein n=1 Tax=Aquincola tertiaricarbonis TaxID=391953 RepID=A0ABY4S2C5_AQUTE|nr:hypothetical protein [Aquincola tertiaricarbonis]URI05823.1 hypothetical protein MW290_07660 [Aquincola tertiaricarbonis]
MVKHFPEVQAASRSWIVAADEHGLRTNVLADLLDQHVPPGDLLVEVHRKLGDCLPRRQAVDFVAAHIGKGNIRITDRAFRGFLVVAAHRVATGLSAVPEHRPTA